MSAQKQMMLQIRGMKVGWEALLKEDVVLYGHGKSTKTGG